MRVRFYGRPVVLWGSVVVPGARGSPGGVIKRNGDREFKPQRKLLAGRIERLLDAHPPSKVLTSMPGNGVRSPHPDRERRRQHLPDRRIPRRLRRTRPRDPQLRLLDPWRTTLQKRKQAAQTGFSLSVFAALGDPRVPGLLRQEDRPGRSTTPRPCSASPAVWPTSSSRCSATEPALLRDQVEDGLPVLRRGIRDTHVRQRPHQSGSKKHFTSPRSRSATQPCCPAQRATASLFPLTKHIGAPPWSRPLVGGIRG